MNPTVSIIVPIYNAQAHLEETVNSLLAQTYRELEIVLVNDGSTDKSPEICRSFAEKDSRVKVINKQNGGSVAARRTGRENSTGEYVMFADADDWYSGDAVQVLMTAIEKEGADIAIARFIFVNSLKNEKLNALDSLGRYIKHKTVYQGDELRQRIIRSFLHREPMPPTLYAKMYKRELFHDIYRYAEGMVFYGDDLHVNMALFANADKVVMVDKVVYYYRTGGGTTKYMPSLFNDLVWSYKNKLKLMADFGFEADTALVSEYFIAFIEMAVNNLLLDKTRGRREYMEKITEYVNDPTVRQACERSDKSRLRAIELMVVEKDVDGIYKYASNTVRKSKYRQKIKKILARFGVRC